MRIQWSAMTCAGIVAAVAAFELVGCPYSIRDSAFLRGDRDAGFQLYLVVHPQTPEPESWKQWLDTAEQAWLSGADVAAEVISSDSALGQRIAQEAGAEQVTADRPLLVLMGDQGNVLPVVHFEPRNASLVGMMDAVAEVVDSPARSALTDPLLEALCVVLLFEGFDADADANARVKQALAQAVPRITGTMTELGKVIDVGPHLVTIAPGDKQERVLRWCLGIPAENSEPTVVMLLGMGERRGPVLVGEEIEAEKLFECFEMFGRSCSCTTDLLWLDGPKVPLAWEPDIDERVKQALGFDPADPSVHQSIAGAAGGPGGGQNALGYREVMLESTATSHRSIPAEPAGDAPSTTAEVAPADRPEDSSSTDRPSVGPTMPPPTKGNPRAGWSAVGVVAVTTLVFLVVASWVLIRRTVGPA